MGPLSSSERASLEQVLSYPLGAAGRAYLEARALLGVASDLRFGEVSAPRRGHERYAGRLVIPSFSAHGSVVDVAFRCIQGHDCKAEDHPKYLFLPGIPKRLYNVAATLDAGREVHITEGQLDAATLHACGLPAVGVPGSQSWKPHCHRLFGGFDRVVVWADGDDAGKAFAEKVRLSLSGAVVMMLPSGEDVNSYYLAHGKQGVLDLIEGRESEADDGETEPPPPF